MAGPNRDYCKQPWPKGSVASGSCLWCGKVLDQAPASRPDIKKLKAVKRTFIHHVAKQPFTGICSPECLDLVENAVRKIEAKTNKKLAKESKEVAAQRNVDVLDTGRVSYGFETGKRR